MLKITMKKGVKIYTIKTRYLNEQGVLNERNVRNACKRYMQRKNTNVCTAR